MELKIQLSGLIDRVVVTTLPSAFLRKIFKHCMGKNNTPYFVNNCFKGVLYFDYEMAERLAEPLGYPWKGWESNTNLHQSRGFCFDRNIEAMAVLDGKTKITLTALDLCVKVNELSLDSLLPKLKQDEILILLGAVDKGTATWILEDCPGEFDPEKLLLKLDSLEELRLPERLATGVSYASLPLTEVKIQATGRNMIIPAMFDANGKELDLYDFLSVELPL
jgi:hypothetical protein